MSGKRGQRVWLELEETSGHFFAEEKRFEGCGFYADRLTGGIHYWYKDPLDSEPPLPVPLCGPTFKPATLRAFHRTVARMTRRLASLSNPEVPLTHDSEAMAIRSAMRNAKAKEADNREKGSPLAFVPARILPEDDVTIEEIALRYARDKSFLIRAAVHMFAESYRRNPKALDL